MVAPAPIFRLLLEPSDVQSPPDQRAPRARYRLRNRQYRFEFKLLSREALNHNVKATTVRAREAEAVFPGPNNIDIRHYRL